MLTKREMIQRLTEQLGGSYHESEVEDFYVALIQVMKEAFLVNKEPVRFESLFTVTPVIFEPRMWQNVKTNKMTLTKKSGSLRIKPSVVLKKQFEES